MVQFKIGDTIAVCASISSFCSGSGNFYILRDINASAVSCTILPGVDNGCLPLGGVYLEFQWTNASGNTQNKTCTPANNLKILGTAVTNLQGIASVQYIITQADLNLYNANGALFDLRVCIRNSNVDFLNYSDVRKTFQGEGITIGQNLCLNVTCADTCIGNDLWSMKCDPLSGSCVQDFLRQANSPACIPPPPTATHVLEIKLKPYSWYTPQGAVDNLLTKINDINGAVLNVLSTITGWAYTETTISHDGTNVYVRVYMRQIAGVQAMVIPAILWVAGAFVATTVIIISVGKVLDWLWGPTSAPTNMGLTNKELGDAGDKYIKGQLGDCELKICTDTTLTQDQKAQCIKNCYDTNLNNWKGYQGDIFKDADHTLLDTGRIEIQKCYDVYNTSAKTAVEYQTLLSCMQLKGNEAVTGDTINTYNTYPPDSQAGVTTTDLVASDCWIPGLTPGSCILTATTGKTVAIISGILVGGYLVISLIKK